MKRGEELRDALKTHGCIVVQGNPTVDDGCAFRVLGGLCVVVSWGAGWDHVSVSRKERCPNYEEMEKVRQIVTLPDETWVQYGVPAKDHVNIHQNCLHWWRPQNAEIPTPPAWMV